MELREDLGAVQRERVLPIDRTAAWELLSDPAELGEWLVDEITVATLRPGERGTATVDGEVRELAVEAIEPRRRISFTWWPVGGEPGDATLVELTLDDDPAGTRLRVIELPLRALRAVGDSVPPAVGGAPGAHGPRMLAGCA